MGRLANKGGFHGWGQRLDGLLLPLQGGCVGAICAWKVWLKSILLGVQLKGTHEGFGGGR